MSEKVPESQDVAPAQGEGKFKLQKTYSPSEFEAAVTARWLSSGAFHAVPDARPPERRFVVMMPLPNVTGALHMGHAMDNVMQDMLVRWHRMRGDNTLWMPGTDHAGIATQAVVEKRLKELEGLTRHDLGRAGLVERIWRWKDQYQARIIAQQQRMGCSADWQRQRFTMDKVCARAVRHTFFRMFEDGLIVRGKRLVNWDPFLRTTISDDEVYHETVQGHFWHLRYPMIGAAAGEPAFVEVATTRPETMLGDTAVAVHPDPEGALQAELAELRLALAGAPAKERPALEASIAALEARQRDALPALVKLRDLALAGRKVLLPLLERPLPLICDAWAKPSLGTGCVKITPAHDPNDYEVWRRHRGEIALINILNPDGTLNESAGPYQGLDRFVARDRVVADLAARELLGEVEDRKIEVGHSDRSKTPIEPYLSDQWFVRMADVPGGVAMGRGTPKEHRSPGLVQGALDAARAGRVRFHPERFLKTYLDWLGEKRDWPVSRQLWWGHRIPVWTREVAAGELPQTLARLFAALGSHEGRARVRLVQPGEAEGDSLLARDADSRPPAGWQGAAVRVDVCLKDDEAGLPQALHELGFEQDPDVLDTWFSSAIWPHSTLGFPDPATADTEGKAGLGGQGGFPSCLDYYYPGSCLVTARDIITLWVARMVITGLYNMGDVPFRDVFLHANILDGKGERMSKSKGNGIDPVDIIEEYGTDSMRYVLCDMQTGNQDIRLPVTAVCPGCKGSVDLAKAKHGRSVFTYKCPECKAEFDVLGTMPGVPAAKLLSERFLDGRKFCNKLWNSARFALGNLESHRREPLSTGALALEDRWILAALNRAVRAVGRGLEEYNPSLALGAARDFLWNELCDWYLELIKPRLHDPAHPSGNTARQVLAHCLDVTLRLLHPFVPFVTEHLVHELRALVPATGLPGLTPEEAPAELLLTSPWPRPVSALDDEALLATFADLQAATTGVRDVRSAQGLSPAQALEVTLRPRPERVADLRAQAHVVERMANVSRLHVDPEARRPSGAASLVVGELQIFVHGVVDDAAERKRLQGELAKVEREIGIADKKLGNAGFVARAPAEVVADMRERKAGYERQREALLRSLADVEG
ncbi:MAG TPA: valine--tRNA ligase [Myxococcota bacterium]|nr:valine--tRNA ligase [Myxococcota bacterium]HRY94387.1 valine--tRNA ligase [Myxococcota bacterium]HSA19999.1 valine--tRNA ligase [Myxococcota bacterium]